jgi:hypothetical protein
MNKASPYRNQGGFSLVELPLVIILPGILAAIGTFGVGSIRSNAVQRAFATGHTSIVRSAEAAKVKTDAYPAGTVDGSTSPNPLVLHDQRVPGRRHHAGLAHAQGLVVIWEAAKLLDMRILDLAEGDGCRSHRACRPLQQPPLLQPAGHRRLSAKSACLIRFT